MRIVVRNKNGRPRFLALFFPLWAIKFKVFAKGLANSKDIAMEADELHQTLKKAYKQIKQFVRENGHFYLVKVDTRDGTKVCIRV